MLNYFCHRAYTVCETTITKGVSRSLRNQIVEKLQILSLQYHASHESGRFVSKLLVDVERTERFAEMLFNTLLASVITVVFSVAVLAADNWKMLLFYLLCIPFYLLVYRYFNVRFGRLQRAARLANEDLSHSLTSSSRPHFSASCTARRNSNENVSMSAVSTSSSDRSSSARPSPRSASSP